MKESGELYDLLGIELRENFDKLWDVIVIGAGPAGLNTALYGARKGLDILILSSALGGQMIDTGEIDNYLGVKEAQGPKLLQSFWEHVDKYGVNLELGATVKSVSKNDDEIIVETEDGHQGRAKAVVAASGTTNRELGVDGEKQLKGRGVHYCATCDGYLYEGEAVAIVGGGNAGLEAALDLSKLGCEVDLIEVQPELTGDEVLQEKVYDREAITVHTGTGVEKIIGDKDAEKVDKLVIKDMETETEDELDVNGVFIEIGLLPNSDFIGETVEVNEVGEIVINDNNETSVEGIWAAGDVTNIKDKQIIISAAEGAKAALRINEYLE
nr:FAD-dependent oxidoreductase [Sporohalobacter salinus]